MEGLGKSGSGRFISITAASTTLVLITLAPLLNATNKSTQIQKKPAASQNEIMNFDFQIYISMNVPEIEDVPFKSSDFGFCLTTLQSKWEEILGIN